MSGELPEGDGRRAGRETCAPARLKLFLRPFLRVEERGSAWAHAEGGSTGDGPGHDGRVLAEGMVRGVRAGTGRWAETASSW